MELRWTDGGTWSLNQRLVRYVAEVAVVVAAAGVIDACSFAFAVLLVAVGGGVGGGFQDGYIEGSEFTPGHLFVHVGDAPSAPPRSAVAPGTQRGACDVVCVVSCQ